MNKGRELGKGYHFKACPRWCDNFLNRNPGIKNILYIRMYEQNQVKSKMVNSNKNYE